MDFRGNQSSLYVVKSLLCTIDLFNWNINLGSKCFIYFVHFHFEHKKYLFFLRWSPPKQAEIVFVCLETHKKMLTILLSFSLIRI